ncbi:MAG: DUF3536 domain-containing protein, partial [Anaerolineales bacterium]
NLKPAYPMESEDEEKVSLITLASDGELYGHHQPLRDYFLQRLMNVSCVANGIQPIYPAKWLKDFSVNEKIAIREDTSWSCPHGLKRWSNGCACTVGDSSWKMPLREALNNIAQELDQVYLANLGDVVADPWELRNRYSEVFLGKKTEEIFLQEMLTTKISPDKQKSILLLLRSQYERQRMFASDGWFFEDFDRIEPRNAVAYAAHAVRLAEEASGAKIKDKALNRISKVKSPITGLSGDRVFLEYY